VTTGFVPPPYPYDRLDVAKRKAEAHEGGCVDLSIGTPCDPPPPAVVEALARELRAAGRGVNVTHRDAGKVDA